MYNPSICPNIFVCHWHISTHSLFRHDFYHLKFKFVQIESMRKREGERESVCVCVCVRACVCVSYLSLELGVGVCSDALASIGIGHNIN